MKTDPRLTFCIGLIEVILAITGSFGDSWVKYAFLFFGAVLIIISIPGLKALNKGGKK